MFQKPRHNCPELTDHLAKALVVAWLFLAIPAGAVNVVVQLRNGDRITGQLLEQATNHIVITTPWAGLISLPISDIGGLRTAEGTVLYAPAPSPTSQPATNPAIAAITKPARSEQKKTLTTTANLGLDLLEGAKDRQIYYARIKSTYAQPYESNPKQYFRTVAEYIANYGETDGQQSANNMSGMLQSDFDFGPRNYFYNAVNVGYDQIRKIDLQYGIGPGVGHHLYTKPTFVLDVEAGANYQAQDRSAGESPRSTYLRLADNMKWKLADRVTLAKKFEYQLSFEDASQFRLRLDSTLSYRVWSGLSLNLTVLDIYDTDPAPNVAPNEFQLRSSVGFTF